ncbi:MAG TPA: hypothetical protein VE757_01390 [Gaiellaceae bacterium]|nr:hypothetical protein [Gaiellaceae bacterium]
MRLLVLGARETALLAAARARGLYVIAVDRDAGAPGFRLARRRAILPLDDELALERLAEAGGVDAVVGTGGSTIALAARIAGRLGLRHPLSPEAAMLAGSPLRRRIRLAELGVPQTRWTVLHRGDEPAFPAVVGPLDRKGRRLAEEAPAGNEVTVTAVLRDGRFEPLLGTGLPAEVARRGALALGIRQGLTSTRLRVGVDGPRVASLEAHVGSREAELCRLLLGVDVHALALDAALGVRPGAEDVPLGAVHARVA